MQNADRHMKGGKKESESSEEDKKGKKNRGEDKSGNRTHTASARQAGENQLSGQNLPVFSLSLSSLFYRRSFRLCSKMFRNKRKGLD